MSKKLFVPADWSIYRGFGTDVVKAMWDAVGDSKSVLGAMTKESLERALSELEDRALSKRSCRRRKIRLETLW